MVELFVGWWDEDESKEAGEQQCAGGWCWRPPEPLRGGPGSPAARGGRRGSGGEEAVRRLLRRAGSSSLGFLCEARPVAGVWFPQACRAPQAPAGWPRNGFGSEGLGQASAQVEKEGQDLVHVMRLKLPEGELRWEGGESVLDVLGAPVGVICLRAERLRLVGLLQWSLTERQSVTFILQTFLTTYFKKCDYLLILSYVCSYPSCVLFCSMFILFLFSSVFNSFFFYECFFPQFLWWKMRI